MENPRSIRLHLILFNSLSILCGLMLPSLALAQNINGKVKDNDNNPIPGTTVYWQGTSEGVITDKNGAFTISVSQNRSKKLIASYVGYRPDTIQINDQLHVNFRLHAILELDEVIIQGERDGVVISSLNPIKTEQITRLELTKAACCDLSGCFETQTTVQPQTTNVLTNSKELRILGLSGVYNQVLVDGFPLIQGLTYTYGISSIPGPLVENIYVSKGANSVLQGYEGISGQINIQTLDPSNSDRFFLNAFLNNSLEKHFNTSYTFKKKKWSSVTALHTVQPAIRIDGDEDTFLDQPLLHRYMVYNKWKYGDESQSGWNSVIALRLLHEERTGGQMGFDPDRHKGSTNVYGQSILLDQPEFWVKTGFGINKDQKISLFHSGVFQQQNSFFGTVHYNAHQTGFYSAGQYELSYLDNEITAGLSLRYTDLNEDIQFTDTGHRRSYNGNYRLYEVIPGIFIENTHSFLNNRMTWIAGARVDHHNKFGSRFTPRTLLKYDLTPKTTIRANAGTGWRTVRLFSENMGMLASSRDILIYEPLRPEEAINMGINLTRKFEALDANISGYLSLDYYITDFQNQVFPDYDSRPGEIIVQNFTGKSQSNGFQSEIFLDFGQRLEWKAGYNYLNVYRIHSGTAQQLPFNSKHKVLTTLSFQPLGKKYRVDLNSHWYGPQKLPDTKANPAEYYRPTFSDPYTVVNAQVTRTIKRFEFYAGCENLFDFRQNQPIISWQDPFGPYFDTSSVWGPTKGREYYMGLRLRL